LITGKTPVSYQQIVEEVAACSLDYCRELFAVKRKSLQIKKEKTLCRNLDRIFSAALALSNRSGFHAMSMRDLSRESGLSIGALYNYFSGKDELLEMMQLQRRTITRRILQSRVAAEKSPEDKLRTAIRVHLYLSEAMQPWFYFSYMEAKNLDERERRAAVQSELSTEQMFADILVEGQAQKVFRIDDARMTAGLIKAMLQDWYLKRPKYARRRVDVDAYARFLISFLERCLLCSR